jgi:hypothetical protein
MQSSRFVRPLGRRCREANDASRPSWNELVFGRLEAGRPRSVTMVAAQPPISPVVRERFSGARVATGTGVPLFRCGRMAQRARLSPAKHNEEALPRDWQALRVEDHTPHEVAHCFASSTMRRSSRNSLASRLAVLPVAASMASFAVISTCCGCHTMNGALMSTLSFGSWPTVFTFIP